MNTTQLTAISQKSKLFFVKGSTNKSNNYSSNANNQNTLWLLKDISYIFNSMPKKFTITTKNGSCKFNTDFLIETSLTISNFFKEIHNELKYDLNIEDPRNVLSKFEELYKGKKVIFEEEDRQTSFEITEKLFILCCPNYMKPESLKCSEQGMNGWSNQNDIKSGVEMRGLEQFIKDISFRTFTIITAKNKYKCNIFGIYLSDVINAQLEKDPSCKEYYYDFDDEENVFENFCKLFNFESIEITKGNMEIFLEIAEDLQIQCIIKEINKFINESGKVTQTIDDQQALIDSIDELFEWLYSIKEKTVNEVKNLIIESQWIETEENVQELAAFIIEVVKTDILLQPYLIELIIELNEQSNQLKNLQILQPFIISKLLIIFKADSRSLFIYSFIYKLYKKKIILKDQLIELLKDYDYQNTNKNIWFLPLLYEIDKNSINSIFLSNEDENKYFYINSDDRNQLKNFFKNYLPDKIDVYEKMLDNNEPYDLITKSLRNDDVDTLQSILSKVTIETNFIPFNAFDDFSIMRNQDRFQKVNHLDYAAAFGSLKCFKYLLLNNHASIDNRTFDFAVYGGNYEIIKIVDQNLSSKPIIQNNKRNIFGYFSDSNYDAICNSIIKHRNDLFDWIYQKNIELNDKKYSNYYVSHSAEHGNAHSIAELIFKGYNFTNDIQSIISKTSENGFYRLTKFLFKIFDENNNSANYHFQTTNSVSYGNLSIFKLFVKRFKFSEIEQAVIYSINSNYYSIINYFFEFIEKKEINLTSILNILGSSLDKPDDKLFKELLNKFQQIRPDLSLTSNFYINLLQKSCIYKNIEGAKTITEIILQINSQIDFSMPFCQSAVVGSNQLCQYFIDKKVKIDYNRLFPSSNSFGLLNREIFSIILKNINPLFKNKFLTSIKDAIINKNKELVDYLFQENAICDNALILAVDTDDIEIVNIVLKYINNKHYLINKTGRNGNALVRAIYNNNLQIVKKLLEISGIDLVVYGSNELEYPIIIAINEEKLDIVNAILDFYGDNIQYQKQQLEELVKEVYRLYCRNDPKVELKMKSIIDRILDVKYINVNHIFTYRYDILNAGQDTPKNLEEDTDDDFVNSDNFDLLKLSDDDDNEIDEFDYLNNKHNKRNSTSWNNNNIDFENELIYNSRIDTDDDNNNNDCEDKMFDGSAGTFLLAACIKNDLNMVKKLLSFDNIDVNQYSFDEGDTALITAVKMNYFQIVKLLVEHPKTNINQSNFHNKTPLFYAVINKSKEIVNLLINDNKFDPDESNFGVAFDKANWKIMSIMISSKVFDFNRINVSVLLLAIKNNDIKALDLLIHHPTFDKNKFKSFLVHLIVKAIKRYEFDFFIKLMQIFDDDINLTDSNGKSLLIHSVRSLNIKVIDYILNNEHFDPVKSDIVTALAESYSSKKPIKIQSIREEEEGEEELDDTIQQPPTVWDNPFVNKRPAGSGYRNQQQSPTRIIRTIAHSTVDIMTVINRLYEYDAAHDHLIDFNKLLPNGKSFFTSISQSFDGIEKVSDFLLNHGADPNLPDINKCYPLMNAIEMDIEPLFLSLIESNKIDFSLKIPVDRFNNDNNSNEQRAVNFTTYLHIAAKSDIYCVLKILDRKSIDINITDDLGNTPLMEACIQNNISIIEILFIYENLDYLHRNKEGKDAIDLMMIKNNVNEEREPINDKKDYLNKLKEISEKCNNNTVWTRNNF